MPNVDLYPLDGIKFPDDTIQHTAAVGGYVPLPQVVFRARMSANVTTTRITPILYNTLVSSLGGGFNTTTGKFAAPIDGYYLLQASAYFDSSGYNDNVFFPQMQIVTSSETFSGGQRAPFQQQTACPQVMCIAKLLVGEEAYAQFSALGGHPYNLLGAAGVTFFTGILLSEL